MCRLRVSGLDAVYMSPVCRAIPFQRGARFHYIVLLKTILLYMQTGLARLGGISLDSNGVPGQPKSIFSCKICYLLHQYCGCCF